MRSSVAAVLTLLAAVVAQHDDSTTTSTIDAGCQRFLDSLNANTKLDTCLKSITTATAAFNSPDSAAAATSSEITAAFDSMCSSTACVRDDVVDLLTQFAGACADDLVTTQEVSSTYDMLYNMIPMRSTLCTKDGAQYCALKKEIVGSSDALQLPEGELAQIVMANLDQMGTANVGFWFLTPDSDVIALCSTCAQDMLAGMVAMQDAVPYAIGINQSPLLQGQAKIWQAVTTKCSAEVAANVAVKGGTEEEDGERNSAPALCVTPVLAGAVLAGMAALAL
jgi:hypothetical protein